MGKDDALLVTLMIYLTSPEEGGQTLFDDANDGKGYHFEPKRGDLAVWWSCDRKGKQVAPQNVRHADILTTMSAI